MRAILSGQTAVAVHIENDKLYSISLNDQESWTERQEFELSYLFEDAHDIIQLENVSRSETQERLELEWERDRSLQLILILLDNEEEKQTRLEAAECLDEFFKQEAPREYVGNHLYSAPLPSVADLEGSIDLSKCSSLDHIKEFLCTLQSDQDEISKRFAAWDKLPISLFGDPESKSEFYYDAVRYGAFRLFVTQRQSKNLALLNLLSHPQFRGKSKTRKIFQNWAALFKESVIDTNFESPIINYENDYGAEIEYNKQSSLNSLSAFQSAKKQKDAIKVQLIEGNKTLALRYTRDLIKSQRRESKPEHIAKSLCDLAQFSKSLGSPELQLEFAKKAVSEAPGDSWSHATLGDAYRSLNEFQDAQKSYHTAGVYGHRCVALTGRAEVLKDLGQLKDTLDIYEQCNNEFPNNPVVLNGRAAALAHFGKLQQALDAYDEILKEPIFDLVTMTGRAQVLRDMGRLDEALSEFTLIKNRYPDEAIPQHARAEVLRELGQIENAEIAFANQMKRFPLAAGARNGHAKTFRDLGRFDDALTEYNETINKFPLNHYAYLGVADTYKKMGNLSEALRAYEKALIRFPRLFHAQVGKASVLVAMNDYSTALKLLPTNLPASQGEWIAYHIRGMAKMRSGILNEAESMFEWGIQENPWASHLNYFTTALSSLRVQQERYEEVIPLVNEIIHPSIEPIARVLIMHASGELGDIDQFNKSFESIRDTSAPVILELRDALVKRYRQKVDTILPDSWFFTHECDSLILAA